MVEIRYRRRRKVSLAAPLRRAPTHTGGELVGTQPVGIRDAARVLNCSPTTLRRWIKAGAPVVTAGRRGRGGSFLIDPAAVSAWRNVRGSEIRRLADHLPALVADACYQVFVRSVPVRDHDGLRNMPSAVPAYLKAGLLSDAWRASVLAVLEFLRGLDPDVPPMRETPEQIRALLRIASG